MFTFFVVCLWNLVCISHLQHISTLTNMCPVSKSHVWLVATILNSIDLNDERINKWVNKSLRDHHPAPHTLHTCWLERAGQELETWNYTSRLGAWAPMCPIPEFFHMHTLVLITLHEGRRSLQESGPQAQQTAHSYPAVLSRLTDKAPGLLQWENLVLPKHSPFSSPRLCQGVRILLLSWRVALGHACVPKAASPIVVLLRNSLSRAGNDSQPYMVNCVLQLTEHYHECLWSLPAGPGQPARTRAGAPIPVSEPRVDLGRMF